MDVVSLAVQAGVPDQFFYKRVNDGAMYQSAGCHSLAARSFSLMPSSASHIEDFKHFLVLDAYILLGLKRQGFTA